MQTLIINTPAEFSYSQCYRFLGRSANECLHNCNNGTIRKLLKVGRKLVLFEITEHENNMNVRFLNVKPTKEQTRAVTDFIIEWFDLNTQLQSFYGIAKKDKLLKPIAEEYYGLRLIGIPDFFEAITWAVIGQQINLTFAFTLKRRFVEMYGEKLTYQGIDYYLYPPPEAVAQITTKELFAMQFTHKKAEYIIGIAKEFVNGNLSKEKYIQKDFETAKIELCKIRGIGNWSANYAIMKTLRYPDAFPIEDVGLHNAIKLQLGSASKPSIQEIKNISVGWKGWYAYATFYLWHSLLSI